MGGSLTVAVAHEGQVACLSNVTCTLGRRDKPYPEAHESTTWTIALVRRGAFRYRAASTNRAHDLRPGWLLLGPPNAGFECSHESDAGDECTSLAISQEVLLDVASHGPAVLSAPPALPPHPRVTALLERARRHPDVDVDELAFLVTEAVVARTSGAPIADIYCYHSHISRVRDALDRIESTCQEPLSLTKLADWAGISPFHFLRVFRRVTGTTPHQYLLGTRVRLAIRMLLDTERPVTEIAYEVGFEDLSNFVRTFHRLVGCSPGVYRRGEHFKH